MTYFGLRLDENDEIEVEPETMMEFDLEEVESRNEEEEVGVDTTTSTKDAIRALISRHHPKGSRRHHPIGSRKHHPKRNTIPNDNVEYNTQTNIRGPSITTERTDAHRSSLRSGDEIESEFKHHYTMVPEETQITRHGSIVMSTLRSNRSVNQNNKSFVDVSQRVSQDTTQTRCGASSSRKIRITRHGNIVVSDFERFDPSEQRTRS